VAGVQAGNPDCRPQRKDGAKGCAGEKSCQASAAFDASGDGEPTCGHENEAEGEHDRHVVVRGKGVDAGVGVGRDDRRTLHAR
jgi:hypothetical protein